MAPLLPTRGPMTDGVSAQEATRCVGWASVRMWWGACGRRRGRMCVYTLAGSIERRAVFWRRNRKERVGARVITRTIKKKTARRQPARHITKTTLSQRTTYYIRRGLRKRVAEKRATQTQKVAVTVHSPFLKVAAASFGSHLHTIENALEHLFSRFSRFCR